MGENHLKVSSSDSYRMREGFFSQRSNLTTIAISMRFRIASPKSRDCASFDSYRIEMTTIFRICH
jgi:hypothetical protein